MSPDFIRLFRIIGSTHVDSISGLAIMVVVIGFNLFGDDLRDSLDPRLRQ